MTSALNYAGSFFDRFGKLTSENFMEGAFWSLFCGKYIFDWSNSIKDRQDVDLKPLGITERVEHVWNANIKLFLATCSLVSGLSMVIAWAADAHLIFLGSAYSVINAMGYEGSGVVSTYKLAATAKQLGRGLVHYGEIQNSHARGDEAIRQLNEMLTLAFYACTAAWAILSGVHAIVGSSALFWTADSLLYYAVLLFGAKLVALFYLPPKPVIQWESLPENGV